MKHLIDKFKANGFDAIFCKDIVEAREEILKRVKGKSVGIGDSHTIIDMEILEEIKKVACGVFTSLEDKSIQARRKETAQEIYITSVNAVSENSAEMVNIDSKCNRIAGSTFGPEQVIYVFGKNKIEPNLEKALLRARNVAAVQNSRLKDYDIPCRKVGKCLDCNSPDRICRVTAIYHKCPKGLRGIIILIDENLGF